MKIGTEMNDYANFAKKQFKSIDIKDLKSSIDLDYKICSVLFKKLENEQFDAKEKSSICLN